MPKPSDTIPSNDAPFPELLVNEADKEDIDDWDWEFELPTPRQELLEKLFDVAQNRAWLIGQAVIKEDGGDVKIGGEMWQADVIAERIDRDPDEDRVPRTNLKIFVDGRTEPHILWIDPLMDMNELRAEIVKAIADVRQGASSVPVVAAPTLETSTAS
jgi:hypothetical protein